MKSIEDFIGFSESSINDAVQDALKNAGNPADFELIETMGSQNNTRNRQYKVTLKSITEN